MLSLAELHHRVGFSMDHGYGYVLLLFGYPGLVLPKMGFILHPAVPSHWKSSAKEIRVVEDDIAGQKGSLGVAADVSDRGLECLL